MKYYMKFVYAALTLSLLTVPTLTACSSTTTSESSVSETKEGNDTLKGNVQKIQNAFKDLQGSLEENDTENMKEYGEELNNQWLTYENDIREKYPLLYTDVEKYLQPLYSEVTKETLDTEKIKELSVQLDSSLKDLINAKETTKETSEQLKTAISEYKKYVEEQTSQLVASTKAFTDAVNANDMEKAKALYGEARVYYERVEPIAESFGDLDPKIDAREGDVDASQWSGFHRIEKALWEDSSIEGMDKYADQLNQDILELQNSVETVELSAPQIVAGAMELLNEAAISKVTGEEERYSHVDLVDFAANVEGSQSVYYAVLPTLNEKNPKLAAEIDTGFNKLIAELEKYKQGDTYIAYTQLTKDQIRDLSQQLSSLSESMAQVAEIFQ